MFSRCWSCSTSVTDWSGNIQCYVDTQHVHTVIKRPASSSQTPTLSHMNPHWCTDCGSSAWLILPRAGGGGGGGVMVVVVGAAVVGADEHDHLSSSSSCSVVITHWGHRPTALLSPSLCVSTLIVRDVRPNTTDWVSFPQMKWCGVSARCRHNNVTSSSNFSKDHYLILNLHRTSNIHHHCLVHHNPSESGKNVQNLFLKALHQSGQFHHGKLRGSQTSLLPLKGLGFPEIIGSVGWAPHPAITHE